ncbi:putative quinol monooxygenase [Ruegeria jejuensis]|uniref:putative quinol monooxygenase n=1 Tax=Ruegeria jejuensis TaxID=3233338 RepID=UPI00355C1D26
MRFSIWVGAMILGATAAIAGEDADDIHWSITMSVNEGMADKVVPLVTRMSEATMANEPDALIYEYMQDGDTVHIYERYADNDAAMLHMSNFGANFAEEFFEAFTVDSIAIYGPAGDDLKEVFADANPAYLGKIAGFAR